MSNISSISSIREKQEVSARRLKSDIGISNNLMQDTLFKIFIEQNFDLDLIVDALENTYKEQLQREAKEHPRNDTEEYMCRMITSILNVTLDISLLEILNTLKDIHTKLRYESVLLFNYLFNEQMKERVVINLILTRLRIANKNTQRTKPLLHSFVAFYLNSLKESIERAKVRDDLRWAASFFAIRIFGMYNISLIDLEDSLSYLEGVPVILDNQKVVGITDSKNLLPLLSKFKQEREIEYSRTFRAHLSLRDGYVIKKKTNKNFKFASTYVAPVLNIADVFYWPDKLAPLIVVVGNIMVIIAPTKE